MTRTVRDMLIYTVSLIGSRAIGFALLPINTHFLRSADYGRLEVLLAFADIGGLLFSLGLPSTLNRFVGKLEGWDERRRVCGEILFISIVSAAGFGILCQALAGVLTPLLPGNLQLTEVRLLLVSLSFEAIIGVGLGWLRIRDRAEYYLVLTLARGLLQAVISTTLLAFGAGVVGIIAGGAIATLIEVVAILGLVLPDTGLRLGRMRLRPLMVYCLPILFAGCAAFTLGSLDRWMLAGAVSASDLARYGVAVKISAVAATLVQPFNMWWTSKRFIVLNGPNGKQTTAANATVGVVIAMLAAVVTALGGPLLILLLTPVEYHSAAAYVPWLALAFAAQEVGTFLNTGCYDRADGFASLSVNLAAAGLIVVLYLLLIPPYGVAGAIAATIGAQGARSLLYHVVSQRRVRLEYPGQRLVLLCIGCCVGVFGAYTGLQPFGAAVAAVPLAAALGLVALQLRLLPLPARGFRIGRRSGL